MPQSFERDAQVSPELVRVQVRQFRAEPHTVQGSPQVSDTSGLAGELPALLIAVLMFFAVHGSEIHLIVPLMSLFAH